MTRNPVIYNPQTPFIASLVLMGLLVTWIPFIAYVLLVWVDTMNRNKIASILQSKLMKLLNNFIGFVRVSKSESKRKKRR